MNWRIAKTHQCGKRDIETLTVHSQARGEEPKVGDFLRTLKERERELEDLKAEFESPEENFKL